jgi:hypothetical protein
LPAKLGGIIISPVASHARSGNLSLSARVMARLGSAWLREPLPLTGVKRTAMLQRGNANY